MLSGLHAPLSPGEEILLRRVALESPGIDYGQLQRLVALALVERAGKAPRLTALGRRRFEALPRAPLLQRRKTPLALFIDATLEKYAPAFAKGPMAALPPIRDLPTPIHLDLREWRQRADRRLVAVRLNLIEHRRQQGLLLVGSRQRLAASRSLLDATALRPARVAMLTFAAAAGS